MDFHEMLRVDRCGDIDELINFEPDPDYYIGKIACTGTCAGFIHHELWEQLCRGYMRPTECHSSFVFVHHALSEVRNVFSVMLVYNNNNNNNNNQDNVYGAVIMAEPLREFTRFI